MSKPPTRSMVRRAFGETVRALRLKIHMSQELLALEAGIDRGYMGGLERGQHSPTIETLLKLLGPLRVSFTDFAREFERALARRRQFPRGA